MIMWGQKVEAGGKEIMWCGTTKTADVIYMFEEACKNLFP